MLFKAYKLLVSLSWALCALAAFGVAYSLWAGADITIQFSGEDVTASASAFFLFLGVMFSFVSGGVYRQWKIILVIVIPYFIFSILYSYDHIFGEYVWKKYVYQSTFMMVQAVLTIHLTFAEKSLNKKRHRDASGAGA